MEVTFTAKRREPFEFETSMWWLKSIYRGSFTYVVFIYTYFFTQIIPVNVQFPNHINKF